ncbi:GSCFA domain-containing protein [Flavobacterium nackdongense]|uniref:GSCFA domain-containing protein n=2 Tax=Flavobacterium nackdongense TaxID=2547394 RepID=A0A4P6YJ04_9FLAO|nr:GSCFA domain-containing protein [Flavobacterium nackdongense]QBN20600.1 GSCFA domain-containing protein [Flavobacterium nackdongense]
MQFRTKISIPQSDFKIDYHSKIVSIGSCFAVNMADKFDYFKFENTCNPFGIIFNPVSIEKMMYRILNQNFFTEEDIFFHNELWHCYELHSDCSNPNKDEFLVNLNAVLKTSLTQLFQASHIIITYGTSWVYRNIESNTIVANCHKVPQSAFSKELLTVATIEKSIQNTIDFIRKINPSAKFIFTVSPVRHLKDGFVENQISKAHLITAIYQILESEICNLKSATYFPSYEIMMDELRDYRFYAEDMIHPSPMAIDYIWQRFAQTTISEATHSIMNEVETIQKGLAHRPFHPHSEQHQKFLDSLNQKIAFLKKKMPHLRF